MAKLKSRICAPCTACCDGWLPLTMNGMEVFPGHPCPHGTKNGCGIYEERPHDPCVIFNCAWVVNDSPLPDWMIPCQSKAIVRLNKASWRGIPVIYAVPVGRQLPRRTLNWLKGFARRTGRLLLYIERSPKIIASIQDANQTQTAFGIGHPEFQLQIANRNANELTVSEIPNE
jgi:hypothetical protein